MRLWYARFSTNQSLVSMVQRKLRQDEGIVDASVAQLLDRHGNVDVPEMLLQETESPEFGLVAETLVTRHVELRLLKRQNKSLAMKQSAGRKNGEQVDARIRRSEEVLVDHQAQLCRQTEQSRSGLRFDRGLEELLLVHGFESTAAT
jgi:hypothetical protein